MAGISSRGKCRSIAQLSFGGVHNAHHPIPSGNQFVFNVILKTLLLPICYIQIIQVDSFPNNIYFYVSGSTESFLKFSFY